VELVEVDVVVRLVEEELEVSTVVETVDEVDELDDVVDALVLGVVDVLVVVMGQLVKSSLQDSSQLGNAPPGDPGHVAVPMFVPSQSSPCATSMMPLPQLLGGSDVELVEVDVVVTVLVLLLEVVLSLVEVLVVVEELLDVLVVVAPGQLEKSSLQFTSQIGSAPPGDPEHVAVPMFVPSQSSPWATSMMPLPQLLGGTDVELVEVDVVVRLVELDVLVEALDEVDVLDVELVLVVVGGASGQQVNVFLKSMVTVAPMKRPRSWFLPPRPSRPSSTQTSRVYVPLRLKWTRPAWATRVRTPQSVPTRAWLWMLTAPLPGTTRVAGPALVMETFRRATRLHTVVVPAPRTSSPRSSMCTAPYAPAGRSHRPFPGAVSPTLQSLSRATCTGAPGLHAGRGNATPQAAATSSRSEAQLPSQLGRPSPSRSARIGVANGSVQSAALPGLEIDEQPSPQVPGWFRKTSKKEPLRQTASPTT
jgi:hypothetical protein